ncbi:Arrestin-like N-terminal, partial [Trinorchestia longiramus]
MLRPARYEIFFDAPGDVYFADQTVTGHVLLEMQQPVNLKGVKLRFKGECLVHFTDSPLVLTSKRSRKVKTNKKRWTMEGKKGGAAEDEDRGTDTKPWKQIVTRKKNGVSVSPLLPSPSPSLDFADEQMIG